MWSEHYPARPQGEEMKPRVTIAMPRFRRGNVAGKHLEQSVSEVQSVLLTARPLAPSSTFCLSELVVERPWAEVSPKFRAIFKEFCSPSV